MLELQRKSFEHAVALAALPLERRNTIPVLSMLRCRANGSVEFEGTDLDMSVIASMPAGVAPWEGQFLLPEPTAAAKAVKTIGADIVRFTPDDLKLGIEAGALSLNTVTRAAEDFPLLRSVDNQAWAATLSAETVAQLARVAIAMSREETRYYLNGIMLHHVDGWGYRAVATDGHRLSVLDLALPDAVGSLPEVILPRKAVGILLTAAARAKGPIRLAVGTPAPINEPNVADARAKPGVPTRASFTFEQANGITATISTKFIDGTYPDYRRVIPTSAQPRSFGFKTADLRQAVRAISIGSKAVRAVRITLCEGRQAAILGRINVDGFSGSIEIPCEHNSGGFEIGLNGHYLLDIADAAAGEEILFGTTDAAGPVLVSNPADTHWTGVLMPMRV